LRSFAVSRRYARLKQALDPSYRAAISQVADQVEIEPTDTRDARLDIVSRLVDAEYSRLAQTAADQIANLHRRDPIRESMDTWLAFVDEVQNGESDFFVAYEGLIRRACWRVVNAISEFAVTILSFDATEDYVTWDEDEPSPRLRTNATQ
jgi:hypothetical protein